MIRTHFDRRTGTVPVALGLAMVFPVLTSCSASPGDRVAEPPPRLLEQPAEQDEDPGIHASVWTADGDIWINVDRPVYAAVLQFFPDVGATRLFPYSDDQLRLNPGENRLREPVAPVRRASWYWSLNRPRAFREHMVDRGGLVVVMISEEPVPLATRDDLRSALGDHSSLEAWPGRSIVRLLEHLDFDPEAPANTLAFHPM